jgi:hypothetical protein
MSATRVPGCAVSWSRAASIGGDLWGSSTLSWDRDWFARHGAKMPKGAHYIAAGRSMTPLTEKLNPTDTGVMRLQFRRDR